jgi:4'-phosphopantetheinyl transferase
MTTCCIKTILNGEEVSEFSSWLCPPRELDLKPDFVDIWRVSMVVSDQTSMTLKSILSIDENDRAAHFHFPVDRNRFIVAHGCLRNILARYLHCAPEQLQFSLGKYGKPALRLEQGIQFSLSHSGESALIAVTQHRRIGVDLEHTRDDLSVLSFAARYFSKAEFAELQTLPLEQREHAFFQFWVLKEAYVKAQGVGLSLPLDSFDVSLSADQPSLLCATRPNPQEAVRWTLQVVEVATGYKAAIAVEHRPAEDQNLQIRLWDWAIT